MRFQGWAGHASCWQLREALHPPSTTQLPTSRTSRCPPTVCGTGWRASAAVSTLAWRPRACCVPRPRCTTSSRAARAASTTRSTTSWWTGGPTPLWAAAWRASEARAVAFCCTAGPALAPRCLLLRGRGGAGGGKRGPAAVSIPHVLLVAVLAPAGPLGPHLLRVCCTTAIRACSRVLACAGRQW